MVVAILINLIFYLFLKNALKHNPCCPQGDGVILDRIF